MEPSPLRIALVGAGGISRAHARAFALCPDQLRLDSVCDTQTGAAAKLAAEYGGPPVFSSHRDLIGQQRPEAALITLPHYLHHPVALDFLEAGIPCLVEKPVTCSAAELRHLMRAATSGGVLLMAGQMRRFGSAVRRVKNWITASPENFGALRSFDVVVQVNIDAYTGGQSEHWILDGAMSGGGVVAGFGIHRLDLIRHLGGSDFAEVTAAGRFDAPFTNGAESQASVLFRMANGATGTLHANGLAPRTSCMDSFTLHGSHGSIMEVGGPLRYATSIGEVTNTWGHQFEGWTDAPDSDDPRDDAFVQQFLAFARAVRSGETPPFNTPEDNFNTIACLDAIAASLRSGRTETVETP